MTPNCLPERQSLPTAGASLLQRTLSQGAPPLPISIDQERKASRQESKAYPLSPAYGGQ